MNKRRFVFIVVSVILCLSTSVPIFPQSQQMPQASPELVALSKIPLLSVMVTDPEGNKLSGAFVNYRSLTSGLNGGGTTGATGSFALSGRLQGSVASGWQLIPVGPHRIEVGMKGFRTWVSNSIELAAGQTRSLTVVLEHMGIAQVKDALSYRRDAEAYIAQAMTIQGNPSGQARSVGEPVLVPIDARAAVHWAKVIWFTKTRPETVFACPVRIECTRQLLAASIRTSFSRRGQSGLWQSICPR